MKLSDLAKEAELALGCHGPDADLYIKRLIVAYRQIKIMGNFIGTYSSEGVDSFGAMIEGKEIIKNVKKEMGIE